MYEKYAKYTNTDSSRINHPCVNICLIYSFSSNTADSFCLNTCMEKMFQNLVVAKKSVKFQIYHVCKTTKNSKLKENE